MRFCDKLAKQRKNNNLSQEQLADKLKVSRQAVSKWESASSYPDMDKMIQMCKILNCTLEDLLDDGTISNGSTTNKLNFNNYLQDFLKFITKTYNMFISMTLKEKIKCIFEMSILTIVELIIGLIIYAILIDVTHGLLSIIPFSISHILEIIFGKIYIIGLLILGLIVIIHLFKIRYLDYFITIEDNNVTEKTVEESIQKKENKYYKEHPKEKIIIRDPKHSSLSFFNLLMKIIIIFIKFFAIIFIIPIIIFFVFFLVIAGISIFHIIYGSLFLYISIALIASAVLCYVAMYFVYNFVFDREINFKTIFNIIIVSLTTIGLSSGLAFVSYLNYSHPKTLNATDSTKKIEYININDKTIIHNNNIEYIIDNSMDNAKLEITTLKNVKTKLYHETDKESFDNYYVEYEINDIFDMYKIIINDLKHKKIRDYNQDSIIKIKLTLSEENYNKLLNNKNK